MQGQRRPVEVRRLGPPARRRPGPASSRHLRLELVDLQHGTSEMKDVGPLLQAISQTETVPVVRVAWNEPAAIMKALDLGAYAIIVPLVNTAEEAAMAVAACRYPPVGMRSSGPVPAVHYGRADYGAHATDEIVFVALIQIKEGLAHLDAIGPTPACHAV